MTTATLAAVVLATATVGELLPLPRLNGRPLPASVAVVGAFALLGAPAWQVVAVAVAARGLAALLRRATARETGPLLLRGFAAGIVAAGAVALGSELPLAPLAPVPVDAGSALLLATAIVVGVPWWESLGHTEDGDAWGRRFVRHVRDNWMTEVALASTAILGAVVHHRLGALAIPFVFFPLVAARSGLQGYLTVRRQHDQTIHAISRLPEELGDVSPGHADRTAALAASAARQLGLDGAERTRLLHAARLHELGRIRHEPDEDPSDRTIALNGASILHQSGLAEVATIVGTHRDHVLGTGRNATILRLACELDLALARTGDGTEALASVAGQLVDPGELRLLGAFDLDVVAPAGPIPTRSR